MRHYFLIDVLGKPKRAQNSSIIKSSHHRCSIKKGVLKNFTKFTGKILCQSLFFNKIAGLIPAALLKKRLWHRCFSIHFVKLSRTSFSPNTSGRLLQNKHFFSFTGAYSLYSSLFLSRKSFVIHFCCFVSFNWKYYMFLRSVLVIDLPGTDFCVTGLYISYYITLQQHLF